MAITYEDVLGIVVNEAEKRDLTMTEEPAVIGDSDVLEDLVFTVAGHFNLDKSPLTAKGRALVEHGSLDVGRLVTFLNALPGGDDSGIDE